MPPQSNTLAQTGHTFFVSLFMALAIKQQSADMEKQGCLTEGDLSLMISLMPAGKAGCALEVQLQRESNKQRARMFSVNPQTAFKQS